MLRLGWRSEACGIYILKFTHKMEEDDNKSRLPTTVKLKVMAGLCPIQISLMEQHY